MLNVIAALKTLASDLDRVNARYSRITLEDITSQVERALLEIDTACDGAADPKLCALRARFLLMGPSASAAPAHVETVQSQAYREYGVWFDNVARALEGDTDEVDVTTWTEWFGEGLTFTQAVNRYNGVPDVPDVGP